MENEFCAQHIQLTNDMTEIKVTLKNIEKEITQGITFKTAMVTSIAGITITLIIELAGFAYLYGMITKQVEINTLRLNKIESIVK